MSDPYEFNAIAIKPHPEWEQGAVVLVHFIPEVGPRFDVWAFPASLVVSQAFA